MSKYLAKKVDVDGCLFDSKKEARRYEQLRKMVIDGEISDLRMQVPYQLLPMQQTRVGKNYRGVKYIADFVYTKDGYEVVEDVKGYRKGQAYALFKVKQKMMKYFFDIEVIEI